MVDPMIPPIDIQPCPYCGSDDVDLHGFDAYEHRPATAVRWILCLECGASGSYSEGTCETLAARRAVERWNLISNAVQQRSPV